MSEVLGKGEFTGGSAMLIIRQCPAGQVSPVQFGLKKAKLILEHLEDIKEVRSKKHPN